MDYTSIKLQPFQFPVTAHKNNSFQKSVDLWIILFSGKINTSMDSRRNFEVGSTEIKLFKTADNNHLTFNPIIEIALIGKFNPGIIFPRENYRI